MQVRLENVAASRAIAQDTHRAHARRYRALVSLVLVQTTVMICSVTPLFCDVSDHTWVLTKVVSFALNSQVPCTWTCLPARMHTGTRARNTEMLDKARAA